MKFKNTVYLKTGGEVSNRSDDSLANVLRETSDWTRGNIVLDGKEQILVPLSNVSAIDSRIIKQEEL